MEPYRRPVIHSAMGAPPSALLDRAPVWLALFVVVGRTAQTVITHEAWGPVPTLALVGVVLCVLELWRLHRPTKVPRSADVSR